MAPIRKGDGTPLEIPGVSEVRSGDGRVFFEGDAIPDSEIDYFERSNVEFYNDESDGDGSAIVTSPVSPSSGLTIDSSTRALEFTHDGTRTRIASAENDGLPYYPQRGDVIIFDVYIQDSDDIAAPFWGYKGEFDGDFAYLTGFKYDDGEMFITKERSDRDLLAVTSASPPTNEWIRGRFDWGSPTLTFDWIPIDENPADATPIESISADDTDFDSGGIGFHGNNNSGGSGSGNDQYYDNVGTL